MCTKLCRLLPCAPGTILSWEGGEFSSVFCHWLGPCLESSCHLWAYMAPPRRGTFHHNSATCWAPSWRGIAQLCPVPGLWEHRAESPLLVLLLMARFPTPVLRNSVNSGITILFVTLGILRPHCPILDSPSWPTENLSGRKSFTKADF